MGPVLELRNLTKDYPKHRALDGVSLETPPGALYALLGPSGCGKTTTLRLIAGFEQPTAGDIFLNGERINHRRPYERNVSTVFQNYALFPHLTVRGNVEYGLRRKGMGEMERRVREVLELVQLVGKESRYPTEISGGERQRAALARSLVLAPDLLLLDEPLSALDPNLRKQVRAELKALQRRVGISFLFVTHDQEEALSLSDRIAVMRQGRIEQVGAPEDVYLRPRTRFVASFLGAVNWLDGAGIRPEATRISRTAPAPVGQAFPPVVVGQAGMPAPQGPGEVRSRPATVERCVFLGNCIQVVTRLATGQAVTVETSRLDGGFIAGEPVHLWWRAADELIFPAEG